MYWYVPEVILVCGIVIGGLWMSCGPDSVWRTLRNVLSCKQIDDANELLEGVMVLERGRNLAWAGGIFGMLTGMIAMLANLSDPSGIGAGLAAALLSPLYAVVLAELIFAQASRFLVMQSCVPPVVLGGAVKGSNLVRYMGVVVIMFAVIDFMVLCLAFDITIV